MSAFVLNRKYESALPTIYVDVDNEEMEYVDGGNGWYNSRSFIGTVLDVAIIAVTGGVSIASTAAARKFIKNYRGTLTRIARNTLLKYVGRASATAISCAIDIALTIGGMIAAGLDYADGNYNGYVFG